MCCSPPGSHTSHWPLSLVRSVCRPGLLYEPVWHWSRWEKSSDDVGSRTYQFYDVCQHSRSDWGTPISRLNLLSHHFLLLSWQWCISSDHSWNNIFGSKFTVNFSCREIWDREMTRWFLESPGGHKRNKRLLCPPVLLWSDSEDDKRIKETVS